jgi:hypothetical protein
MDHGCLRDLSVLPFQSWAEGKPPLGLLRGKETEELGKEWLAGQQSMAGRVAKVVKHLPGKCEALSSNSSAT